MPALTPDRPPPTTSGRMRVPRVMDVTPRREPRRPTRRLGGLAAKVALVVLVAMMLAVAGREFLPLPTIVAAAVPIGGSMANFESVPQRSYVEKQPEGGV